MKIETKAKQIDDQLQSGKKTEKKIELVWTWVPHHRDGIALQLNYPIESLIQTANQKWQKKNSSSSSQMQRNYGRREKEKKILQKISFTWIIKSYNVRNVYSSSLDNVASNKRLHGYKYCGESAKTANRISKEKKKKRKKIKMK